MNTVLTNLKKFVGLADSEDEYEVLDGEEFQAPYSEESTEDTEQERSSQRRYREQSQVLGEVAMGQGTPRSNVIGMPGLTNGISEVVVIEPHSFEEMPQVIQTLRERRSVVLNLNIMDPEEAQRAVDFVAGGTYAIDGHQERIGESIFLFTPSCVKVSTLSGVLRDIPEPSQAAPSVMPTPAWSAEMSRIAQ